jgi:hypothetical protein
MMLEAKRLLKNFQSYAAKRPKPPVDTAVSTSARASKTINARRLKYGEKGHSKEAMADKS